MISCIRRFIPISLRRFIRRIYYFPVDCVDLLLGKRNRMVPPKGLISIYQSLDHFEEIGNTLLKYFIELGGLKPDDKFLDVGSGIGRIAIPLTRYLNERGRYEGFDIDKIGINWCKTKISSKYPNFHFQLFDVYNRTYNPKGRIKSNELIFPYENESFDLVSVISVFTHMLPNDVEHYFSEISRVLKKYGKCLITFFLLNKESRKLLEQEKGVLNFKHDYGYYSTIDQYFPEDAIAYGEAFVFNLYEKNGLRIEFPVHYGKWCERSSFLWVQDIIIASKTD